MCAEDSVKGGGAIVSGEPFCISKTDEASEPKNLNRDGILLSKEGILNL
jgi:hypothetical protein